MIGSLKGVDYVGGKKLIVMDELREKYPERFNKSGQMDYEWFERDIRPNHHLYLRHDKDSLTFNMMTSPVSEGGKGCQATDLIEVALRMISFLNHKHPCPENAETLQYLSAALVSQEARTRDRENREVEGHNLD